jgi:hypothetical protein
MPGTGFKKLAQKWRPIVQEMNSKPYAFVKSQLEKGVTNNSYAARLIQAGEPSLEISSINEWSASALFGGAGDTVSIEQLGFAHPFPAPTLAFNMIPDVLTCHVAKDNWFIVVFFPSHGHISRSAKKGTSRN